MHRMMLLSLALLSSSAFAQQAATQPAATMPAAATPAAATPAPAKPKLVCRTDPQIGSLLPGRKVCMTAAQWDANAREGRTELEHSTSTLNGKVGGP